MAFLDEIKQLPRLKFRSYKSGCAESTTLYLILAADFELHLIIPTEIGLNYGTLDRGTGFQKTELKNSCKSITGISEKRKIIRHFFLRRYRCPNKKVALCRLHFFSPGY